MVDALEALLREPPVILRLDPRRSGPDGEPVLVAADLEAPTAPGAEPPRGFTWRAWDDSGIAERADPGIADAIPRWIARRTQGPFPADPPWAVTGWAAVAIPWMLERLAEEGHPATEPPRYRYGWGISTVWRAQTGDGPRYLKCSAPVFGTEAAVTAALAARTPELVTPLVAIDAERDWLLMRDLGDRVLGREPAATWGPGLDALATLQRSWGGDTAALARAGAPDRTLARLVRVLPELADREPLTTELSPEERREWEAVLPRLEAACRRLDELGPPPTLVHGDFHPWNVALTADRPRIFDWTDAAIGHPFTDLAVFVTRAADLDVRRRLLDGYLAHWSDLMPPDALAEAGHLALVAGAIHQVDAYVRIQSSLESEDAAGLSGATRSWALAAIDTLKHGIATRRAGHADG